VCEFLQCGQELSAQKPSLPNKHGWCRGLFDNAHVSL